MARLIRITAIQTWTDEEILLLDPEDYQYQIKDVTKFEHDFFERMPFDDDQLDYMKHMGMIEFDKEFDQVLPDSITKFIRCRPVLFHEYATKIN